jgi:hypothetical protein
MNNQYDKELIIDIIEQMKFLGLEGFYLGKLDDKFLDSQNELKRSMDKIIVCLEWLDTGLGYFTYFAKDDCLASEIKEMIQNAQHPVIPLGCVITALLYFHNRIAINSNIESADLVFNLTYFEKLEREHRRRMIYEIDL